MRTVIYARFSSQLQNPRSTADQIADCRARAEREGWPIVGIFADNAISGAAGIDETARPELAQALAMIEAGKADQLLAESTDRIARHQGDAFAVRERLDYAGARLFTLLDGVVDDITGTIKGLFDARFRKDLRARILRGQRGTVAQGRLPAGLAYGYRKANRLDANGNLIRGLREIDPEQAAIVVRIFEEAAAGASARGIAQGLNRDGIPGPRGGTWTFSTIQGDARRQNGMLRNRIYIGEIVHSRTSKVTDPQSRRVRIRANAEAQWVSHPAPELRIISDDLWARVQARREAYAGVAPQQARRPKHMLSGLAYCGTCGHSWTIIGRERWGCSSRRNGRLCSNNRTLTSGELERRVLAGLQDEMLHPEAVRAYEVEYHRDFARRAAELRRDKGKLERRHADADARVKRLVGLAADGLLDDVEEIRGAIGAAKAERQQAAAQLQDLEDLPVVALFPGIAEEYRRQATQLNEAMAAGPEARQLVVPILRGLIDRVTVTPRADKARGVTIDLSGRLQAILALATGVPAQEEPQCMVTMERVKGIEPSS